VSRPGGGSAEVASRAGLDCTSSRDAWRWACQESKLGAPARDAPPVKEAAARVKDPVTTGSLAAPKAVRTAPAKTASAEPQPAMPAATAPHGAAAAKPEARPAPQPVAPPEPATTGSIAPAPPTPDEAKPSATAWVSPPGATTPAVAPPRPEPAPAAATLVEPPQPAASSAPARSLVASRADEPAVRRAVQARAEPIVAIPAKRKVVASASVDERPKAISPERAKPRPVVEKPARVARHRPAPLAHERALQPDDDEDDDGPAASAPPLLRQSRLSARSDTGLSVSSVETRVMPDGRVMTVNVMPRPDVVRSLVARHTQSYASPRSRAPYWDW
jgi:hypothetical protein